MTDITIPDKALETDEEFVERMRYIEHAHEPLKEADRDRLLSLADRGAAVRWRKIEEAPRDGTSLLGVTPYDFDARIFAWGKTSHLPLYGWVYIDQGWESLMTAPDITIPPEALEVAELAYTEALSNGEDPIRAACLAMLKHWPGMTTDGRELHFSTARGAPVTTVKAYSIILPLPQETSE